MNSSDPLRTPVLLVTFNRPELTREVLAAIRQARPERLFVASDGPRPHIETDAANVAATRAIIEEMVDWPCEVQRRFSETNRGCRVGVSSAISWFFESVEEGIILEDDCVPHPDFFGYCTELLERYRCDERVMSIAGSNTVALSPSVSDVSYCFTRQPLIWGWATWRRAWSHYDSDLNGWRTIRNNRDRQRTLWADRVERRWQHRKLDQLLFEKKPDTWDYQWSFTVAARQGLSATPTVNLIRNIGFGSDATHTTTANHPWANVPMQPIFPLTHPATVEPDSAVERQIFDRVHGGAVLRNPARRFLSIGKRVAKRAIIAAGSERLTKGIG